MATWKKIITSGSIAELNHLSASGDIVPVSDGASNIGSAGQEFQDLYIDGTAYIDSAQIDSLGAALNANNQAITNIDINSGTIDGVTLGTNSAITEAQIDNININGSTIKDFSVASGSSSSTGSFGQLTLVNYNQGYGNINNTFFGFEAGKASTNQKNVAIGYQALSQEVDSGKNIAIGYQAMYEVASADQNTAIGMEAGYQTNQDNTIYIGYQAGKTANSFHSVLIGNAAGYQLTGGYNVVVGGDGAYEATGATYNTFVGVNVARGITTGDGNVFIGYGASGSSADSQNRIAIGSASLATADNQTVIGNSSQTEVKFGGDVTIGDASGNISGSSTSTGSFALVDSGRAIIGESDVFGGTSGIGTNTKFYVQSAVNQDAAAIKSNGTGHALILEGPGGNFLFLTNGSAGGQDDWKIGKGNYGLRIQSDKSNLPVLELRPESSAADTIAALTITDADGERQAVITSGDGTYSGSLASTGSFGRIEASTLAGHSPITIESDVQFIDGQDLSGSFTSTGSFGRLQTAQANALFGSSVFTLADHFTTQNNAVTINAAGADRTITLNESLTIGDGSDGTLTFSAGSKTLTVEDNSTVNQDLTTDANVTFATATTTGNVTVGGNLTVNGDTTTVATSNLTIQDAFGFFATGSAGSNVDAGIVVQSGSFVNSGSAFYHDINDHRWAVAKSVAASATSITALQHVVTVDTNGDNPPNADSGSYGVGEMWVDDSQEIWIRTA